MTAGAGGAGPNGAGPGGPFDVVVIVASAGGLEAISRVVRDVRTTLPVPIVVAQHLAGHGSQLVRILARRLPHHRVAWAEDGSVLRPGTVTVCRARHELEVLPDGTCSQRPLDGSYPHRPLDTVLISSAGSFAERTLAVVLTGMGRDATAGTRAVHAAGGTVLVQDHETAEQPSMPRSVIEAGVADRVLPVHEIGRAVRYLAAGRGLPPSRADVVMERRLFAGGGEVARAGREVDWRATALGAVSEWPPVLRTTLRLALETPLPMCLLWGADHVLLYNDAYRAIMGGKHPAGLGRPNRESWPEVRHLAEQTIARVLAGEPVVEREALYPITRRGALEDAWFDVSYSPVHDGDGVGGVLCTVVERTTEVLAARRLGTLHALTDAAAGATTWRGAFERALEVLAHHRDVVAYALGYRVDDRQTTASLVRAVGVDPAGPLAQRHVVLGAGAPGWPLPAVLDAGEPVLVDDVGARFALEDPTATAKEDRALLVPLRHAGRDRVRELVVLGVPPRLRLDAVHEEFLRLLAGTIAARLREALAREKERDRSERLTELDRAKTRFFANVSHEFRTPLTLMLAPLDALLDDPRTPTALHDDLDLVRRHSRRLLRLVGSLLDFSQAEAGRTRARFEPTDLARLTADIAGVFRSAADRATIALHVDVADLPEPVWVDPEMWEKILSNLLSNALKYTYPGGRVAVSVRALPRHAEIRVSDTGVGIPADEQPRVFQRFHRGRLPQGRTHEGVGIGLALVDELVRHHHGRVRLHSEVGVGTTMTVWLPFGPRPRVSPDEGGVAPAETARLLAEEAAAWRPDGPLAPVPDDVRRDAVEGTDSDPAGWGAGRAVASRARGARVLVADDNPDLRDYLQRVLAARWEVVTAGTVREALVAASARRPDLVLGDVMMPEPDGLGLLEAIRGDATLRTVPVVLMTARILASKSRGEPVRVWSAGSGPSASTNTIARP